VVENTLSGSASAPMQMLIFGSDFIKCRIDMFNRWITWVFESRSQSFNN